MVDNKHVIKKVYEWGRGEIIDNAVDEFRKDEYGWKEKGVASQNKYIITEIKNIMSDFKTMRLYTDFKIVDDERGIRIRNAVKRRLMSSVNYIRKKISGNIGY